MKQSGPVQSGESADGNPVGKQRRRLCRRTYQSETIGAGPVADGPCRRAGRQFSAGPEIRDRGQPDIGVAPAQDRHRAGHIGGRAVSTCRHQRRGAGRTGLAGQGQAASGHQRGSGAGDGLSRNRGRAGAARRGPGGGDRQAGGGGHRARRRRGARGGTAPVVAAPGGGRRQGGHGGEGDEEVVGSAGRRRILPRARRSVPAETGPTGARTAGRRRGRTAGDGRAPRAAARRGGGCGPAGLGRRGRARAGGPARGAAPGRGRSTPGT